jgi:hypothetical protein
MGSVNGVTWFVMVVTVSVETFVTVLVETTGCDWSELTLD